MFSSFIADDPKPPSKPHVDATLTILVSAMLIVPVAAIYAVLADRLVRYYCMNQRFSPLSGRSQLSRDLDGQVRGRRDREAIATRLATYLRLGELIEIIFVDDGEGGGPFQLPTYEQSEREQTLAKEEALEVFVVGDE